MAEEVITKDEIDVAIAKANDTITYAISTGIIKDNSFLTELNEQYLEKVFEKNLDFNVIKEILMPQISYVRGKRSSYLPIEFFQRTGDLEEEIVDEFGELESFENTFMRLLGMPDAVRLVDGNPDGDTVEEILTIDFNGNVKKLTFSGLVEKVLDERQLKPSQRIVKTDPETVFGSLSSDTFDLDKEDLETLDEVSKFTPVVYNENGEQSIGTSAKFLARLDNFNQNVMKFSYLLVPPVQDYRIAKTINEPSKIVPQPFDLNFKSINGKDSLPPLIESIVRIRLDRLSGSRINSNDEVSLDKTSLSPEAPDYLNANNYGLLEAIILKRLDASLVGLAKLCGQKIVAVKEALEKTGTVIKNPTYEDSSYPDANTKTAAAEESTSIESEATTIATEDLAFLRELRTVEDSILALLSTEGSSANIVALDEQENTLRSSSVIKSHLSNSFIGILKTQMTHLDNQIDELNKKVEKGPGGAAVQKPASEVKTIIGLDIGIGIVDILIYCLALFSLDEESLLGLLPKKSFEYLKKEYNSLLPGTAEQKKLLDSINNLTRLVISGYKKFESKV